MTATPCKCCSAHSNGAKRHWISITFAGLLAIVGSVSYAHTRFVSWEQYRVDQQRLEGKIDYLIWDAKRGAAPSGSRATQAQFNRFPSQPPGGPAPFRLTGSLNGERCSVLLLEAR